LEGKKLGVYALNCLQNNSFFSLELLFTKQPKQEKISKFTAIASQESGIRNLTKVNSNFKNLQKKYLTKQFHYVDYVIESSPGGVVQRSSSPPPEQPIVGSNLARVLGF
jgi:hypothetical protein